MGQFQIEAGQDGILVTTTGQQTVRLVIPLSEVDEVCEAIYWARKSVLQAENDRLKEKEAESATDAAFEEASFHPKS